MVRDQIAVLVNYEASAGPLRSERTVVLLAKKLSQHVAPVAASGRIGRTVLVVRIGSVFALPAPRPREIIRLNINDGRLDSFSQLGEVVRQRHGLRNR